VLFSLMAAALFCSTGRIWNLNDHRSMTPVFSPEQLPQADRKQRAYQNGGNRSGHQIDRREPIGVATFVGFHRDLQRPAVVTRCDLWKIYLSSWNNQPATKSRNLGQSACPIGQSDIP